jgi:hypothetical protein
VLVTDSRCKAGGTIFDGQKVKADPNLADPASPKLDPKKHTQMTTGVAPKTLRRVRYYGPKACAARDGCLL